jgi:hypothetical protein
LLMLFEFTHPFMLHPLVSEWLGHDGKTHATVQCLQQPRYPTMVHSMKPSQTHAACTYCPHLMQPHMGCVCSAPQSHMSSQPSGASGASTSAGMAAWKR